MQLDEFRKLQSEIPDEILIKKGREWITKLCRTGGHAWSLRVPPDPEADPDMIFGEIIRRLEKQSPKQFGHDKPYKIVKP